jgi:hypothetical protein
MSASIKNVVPLVVQHQESGVYRLSDVVGSGEQVVYHPPTHQSAHNYLHQLRSSRSRVAVVRVGQPAVNGKGRHIRLPME